MSFTPSSLYNLLIWTPKNVPEGKEYEKLLYFYPPDTSLELQTKNIGLSEAMINFTR